MIKQFKFLLGLYSLISVEISPKCPCQNAYVWLFNDSVSNSVNVEENYSELFEEVIADRAACKVLERRNYATLLQHEETEKEIIQIEDFDSVTIKKLTTKIKADGVVLGSVESDVDSPSITIRVKFLDISKKELYKKAIPQKGFPLNTPIGFS